MDRNDIEKKVNPEQVVVTSERFQRAVERIEKAFSLKVERETKLLLSKIFRVNMFKRHPSKYTHWSNTSIEGPCIHTIMINDTTVSFFYSQDRWLSVKLYGVYRDVRFNVVMKTNDRDFIRTVFRLIGKNF